MADFQGAFDWFESWFEYHHVPNASAALHHVMLCGHRTSYSINHEIHVDLSFADRTLHLHSIGVRNVRQGVATRFMQELATCTPSCSVMVHGPYTDMGRAWLEKMGLLTQKEIGCQSQGDLHNADSIPDQKTQAMSTE
jgi:hypothetical protein